MRVYGFVFCSVPLLFVYLRMRISSNASSTAGVPYDSVRTTLLLRTARSCCNWSANCVAVLQLLKPKTKKVHCGSAFEPGASGLPNYCTPLVCVLDIIGGLSVFRHNNKKNRNQSVQFPCHR